MAPTTADHELGAAHRRARCGQRATFAVAVPFGESRRDTGTVSAATDGQCRHEVSLNSTKLLLAAPSVVEYLHSERVWANTRPPERRTAPRRESRRAIDDRSPD